MARRACPNCGGSYDDESRATSGPFHFLVVGVQPAPGRWIVNGQWVSGLFTSGDSVVQSDEQGRRVRLDEVEMEEPANDVALRRSHRRLLVLPHQAGQLAINRCLWSTSRGAENELGRS
jgi:hypothetical protein